MWFCRLLWALEHHPEAVATQTATETETIASALDVLKALYTDLVDREDEFDRLDGEYLEKKHGGVPALAVQKDA